MSDQDKVLPPRPSLDDDAILQKIAEKLWNKGVKRWLQDGGDLSVESEDTQKEALEDLVYAIQFEDDGHRIANKLSGWNADSELVHILDNVSFIKHDVLKEAEIEWVKTHNIITDWKKGDKVKVIRYNNLTEGTIVSVDHTTAKCTVYLSSGYSNIPSCRTIGSIINAEDVFTLEISDILEAKKSNNLKANY